MNVNIFMEFSQFSNEWFMKSIFQGIKNTKFDTKLNRRKVEKYISLRFVSAIAIQCTLVLILENRLEIILFDIDRHNCDLWEIGNFVAFSLFPIDYQDGS